MSFPSRFSLMPRLLSISAAAAFLALGAPIARAQQSAFYAPIRNNDLASLRKLVKDAGAGAADKQGNTPLMYAAGVGSIESMRILLETGADPNAASASGSTALLWCTGELEKVKLLLAHGANVKSRTKLGRTALHTAAYYCRSADVVRLLIDKGADVNAYDDGGTTPLIAAASTNNLGVARILVDRGANVNPKDDSSPAPLDIAAGSAQNSSGLTKLLIAHGAHVNRKIIDPPALVQNGPLAIGQLTSLMFAANSGDAESVAAIIKAGANVNALDIRKFSALTFAVGTDHPNPAVVRLLLSHGADPAPAVEWAKLYRDPAVLREFGLSPIVAKDASHGLRVAAAGGTPVDSRFIRDAVARSLAVSQSTAQNFTKTGGCTACHAQILTTVSFAAAKKWIGVSDTDWDVRTTKISTTTDLGGPAAVSLSFEVTDSGPGPTLQQNALLQISASGLSADILSDAMVHFLLAYQSLDGDWKTGELVRSPLSDGSIPSTARALKALCYQPPAGIRAVIDEHVARGVSWLMKAHPVTTDDRAFQILGLRWAGGQAPAKRVKELVARQRSDGGWGQTDQLDTDAYATGQALRALHEAGMPSTDPAYQRGVDFLLRTQAKDGTWRVVARSLPFQPYFESGFPYGSDQWISHAGTNMAIIALSYAVN